MRQITWRVRVSVTTQYNNIYVITEQLVTSAESLFHAPPPQAAREARAH